MSKEEMILDQLDQAINQLRNGGDEEDIIALLLEVERELK